MKTLHFNHDMFLPGENCTVRRGVCWSLESHALVQHGIHQRIAQLECKVLPFNQLTDQDLARSHDPLTRDKKGLLSAMRDFYMNFDEREIVTLVTFWLP